MAASRPVPAPSRLVRAAAGLLAAGCGSGLWAGYEPPRPGDFRDVDPGLPYCMEIGTQNLDDRQERAVLEAARDVCALFVSPRFEAAVGSRDWLASCEPGPDGRPDVIAGADLVAGYMAVPPFSVHPVEPPGGPSFARADFGSGWGSAPDNRVAIDPGVLEAWHGRRPAERARLIEILAREITHLDSSRFNDEGHGPLRCPSDALASHGVGAIAAGLWLESRPDRGPTVPPRD